MVHAFVGRLRGLIDGVKLCCLWHKEVAPWRSSFSSLALIHRFFFAKCAYHEEARTGLYDRTSDEITLDEVERIEEHQHDTLGA
jgi:hypothetical protein